MSCPICKTCGYPITSPNQPTGYTGPMCMGHPDAFMYYRLPKRVTEDDVRRIIREELAQVKGEG